MRQPLLKALPFILLIVAMFAVTSPVHGQQSQTAPVQIGLSDCRFSVGFGSVAHNVDAKCAVFPVPENPALTDGRKINLRVTVLPALDTNAKGIPIFHLEGGPGASAIQGFGLSWYDSFAELRKSHPIVLIDQRGTGRSGPLNCTEVNSQIVTDLSKALTEEEEEANMVKRLDACYKRLSRNADLRFYTSIELADDTDAVRAALGYDQIEIFGNSYGTSLAQMYLKRHGEHVAGAVLDSVTGPWNYPFLDAPNNGQASLDKVFALCAADTTCNKKYPRLNAQLKKVLETLEAKPQTITATNALSKQKRTVVITAGRIKSLLFGSLYSTMNITEIPMLISQMAAGNYVSIGNSLAQASNASSIAQGMYMSVTCAENAAFYTENVLKAHAQHSLFVGADLKRECKVWPAASLKSADVAAVRSNRPVLILSGGLDPITPVRFGAETRARFPRGGFVVFPNQGHGIIPGSKCAQGIVETFFANPTKTINGACAAKDLKPLFAGAYSVDFVPFTGDYASFSGQIPKGWKTEQDDAITFMKSPDGLQFAGVGIYRFQKPDIVIDALLTQIKTRFGAVEVKEQQTTSVLFTSQVALVFTLNRPDQVYYGVIILQTHGNNTYAYWQAAPINWFSASVFEIAPKLLLAIKEPS